MLRRIDPGIRQGINPITSTLVERDIGFRCIPQYISNVFPIQITCNPSITAMRKSLCFPIHRNGITGTTMFLGKKMMLIGCCYTIPCRIKHRLTFIREVETILLRQAMRSYSERRTAERDKQVGIRIHYISIHNRNTSLRKNCRLRHWSNIRCCQIFAVFLALKTIR